MGQTTQRSQVVQIISYCERCATVDHVVESEKLQEKAKLASSSQLPC